MDQELEKLIKERYQLLPDEVKEALKALPIEAIMQEIASRNGLHVDQIGDIYTETILVVLGVEKVGNFKKNIQSNLQISPQIAENVLNDVNQKIFLSIRQFLQSIEEVHENLKTLETEDDSGKAISRENILSEIENPTPAVHPISIANQTVAGPAQPREIINTPREIKMAGKSATENRETVASEFIAGKLTETVSLPSQRVNIASQTTDKPKERPKNYTADPYREPIS